MNKTDFKTLVVILVVLLIFSIIVLILYNVTEKEKVDMSGNFIVDGNRFFEYNGTKWSDLGSIDSIIMNKFKIYSNNTYVGSYSVSENNGKYYFFDDEYESHDVTSPFIAISEDSEVSVIDYKKADFNSSDYNKASEYLKSIDIDYDGEYNISDKYIVDLDNDNNSDYIYVLSNQLYSDDVFYVVFANIDNDYITINKQIGVSEIKRYTLGWVLNITNDKLNDIILREEDRDFYNYYLYRYFKGSNEYQRVLPNE